MTGRIYGDILTKSKVAMGFADEIRKANQKILEAINAKVTEIAVELMVTTVDYSPKQPVAITSKGELINNWFPYVDTTGSDKESSFSDTGEASKARISGMQKNIFLGKDATITFANGVDYSYQAEYVGWNVTQPYAMVRGALSTVTAKYG